jgi:hypothetical protein
MATKDIPGTDRNVGVYETPSKPIQKGTAWAWWVLAIVLIVLLAIWLF